MPFLLRPYLLDARWAWRSEVQYLHILTDAHSGGDLEQYRWKLTRIAWRWCVRSSCAIFFPI